MERERVSVTGAEESCDERKGSKLLVCGWQWNMGKRGKRVQGDNERRWKKRRKGFRDVSLLDIADNYAQLKPVVRSFSFQYIWEHVYRVKGTGRPSTSRIVSRCVAQVTAKSICLCLLQLLDPLSCLQLRVLLRETHTLSLRLTYKLMLPPKKRSVRKERNWTWGRGTQRA